MISFESYKGIFSSDRETGGEDSSAREEAHKAVAGIEHHAARVTAGLGSAWNKDPMSHMEIYMAMFRYTLGRLPNSTKQERNEFMLDTGMHLFGTTLTERAITGVVAIEEWLTEESLLLSSAASKDHSN